MNMDVHCDIDEKLLERNKRILRYPEYAHILYLTVQLPTTQNNITAAPTCLFPTKMGGWMPTTPSCTKDHEHRIVDLVIVPAVSGRVVRFSGSMMHAVPKPSNRWFTSIKNVESEVHQEHDNDDDDDDNCNDSNTSTELRSVLLFNCWSNDMPPPLGLKMFNSLDNTRQSDVPDGIVIDDDDDDDDDDSVPVHGTINDSVRDIIAPIPWDDNDQSTFTISNRWKTTLIMTMDQSEVSEDVTPANTTLLVGLMGKKYRRQYNKAVAKLDIHPNDETALLEAFNEPLRPTLIQLLQSNDI